MGNKPEKAAPVPRLARGELVEVCRNGKWRTAKVKKVATNGTVTVAFSMYGRTKELEIDRRDYAKKLATPGTHTDDAGTADEKTPVRARAKVKNTDGLVRAEEVNEENLESAEAVDYLDVLDKTKPLKPFDPFGAIMVKDSDTPPAPTGGWRWRPAMIEGLDGDIAKVHFMDAELRPTFPENGTVNLEDDSLIAEYGTMSGDRVKHHDYQIGDVVDVLDYFRKKGSKEMGQKWRKCQIVNIDNYHIRVTFVGWRKAFDIWLHVLQQADRIAEFGSKTEAELKRREDVENEFIKRMRQDRTLAVITMAPDGNCLFRAVAHQVYGDVERHDIVRSDCCDYIEKNRERFEPLLETGEFDQYLEHKRQLKVWGDDPEVRAMEELYDRPVQIYMVTGDGTNTEPLKLHFDGDLPPDSKMGPYEPIRLSFHGDNHYNSVIPYIEGVDESGKSKDVSVEDFIAPPLRTKGIIRSHRRVRVKSNVGFRVETTDFHEEDDDESKDAN